MTGSKRRAKHSLEFRREAVRRMKESVTITGLAEELGIERSLLYKWRKRLDPKAAAAARRTPKADPERRERKLEEELTRVKRVLAEKTLEIDFFRGALQRIEARRRSSSDAAETTSTSRSGK